MTDYFLKALCALQADRRGVTALEYALIAAVVAGVVVTAFTTLGTDISTKVGALATDIAG